MTSVLLLALAIANVDSPTLHDASGKVPVKVGAKVQPGEVTMTFTAEASGKPFQSATATIRVGGKEHAATVTRRGDGSWRADWKDLPRGEAVLTVKLTKTNGLADTHTWRIVVGK